MGSLLFQSVRDNWAGGTRTRRCAAVFTVVCLLMIVAWGCRKAYVAWHVRAARAALSEGNAGLALVALRQAEPYARTDAEILFLLARALRRHDELTDVHAYLDRAVLAGWPEDQVRHQRYLILMQTGNFNQAENYLTQILGAGSVSDELAAEIYEARVKGYFSIYDLKEALVCIEYWLKWRPHERQARMWRAEIWERTSVLQEAISDYRKVLEHDPKDFEARLKLADALLLQHDVQGALGEYQKCVAGRPDDVAALLGVMKCQLRIGDLSQAKTGLRALLERDLSATQKGEVLLELGEMALFNLDYPQAADYLSQARVADPTNRFIYQPLSRAYARLGKTDLAEEAKRRGEEITKRFGRISELTNKMVLDPQNPELRYETGMLFFAEGATNDGAVWLLTALKYDPEHRKTHAALADYYEGIGNAVAAGRHRRMAEASEKPGADRSKSGSSSG